MQSRAQALVDPMDLQSFEDYISEICAIIKHDPLWPELPENLKVVRELLNVSFAHGSVFNHAAWVSALTRLTSLPPDQLNDHIVLAIARHLGSTHEYNRLVIPKISAKGREELARILTSDARKSIGLPFLHTLEKFATCCQGDESSLAIMFACFLQMASEGKFRRQDVRTRNENCLSALKSLNRHLSKYPENSHTLKVLSEQSEEMLKLLHLPIDDQGHRRAWMGVDLYVVIHKLGYGDSIPEGVTPEHVGNPYNSMLRLQSIGKAPEPSHFNDRLISYPQQLAATHLSYAIQNPDLVLPLEHLALSAMAFDVLTNWLKELRTMELPTPQARDRLAEVFKTLAIHKPSTINHIIACGVVVEGMMEVEVLREAMLQRDIGL